MNGKGSTPRRVERARYEANFDRVFGAESPPQRWGFAYHQNAERWDVLESRRAALLEAASSLDWDDDVFLVPMRPVKSSDVIDVDPARHLVEEMASVAYDRWEIDDWPDTVGAEQIDELTARIRAWADEHIAPPHWFEVAGEPELATDEELAEAHADVIAGDPTWLRPQQGERWLVQSASDRKTLCRAVVERVETHMGGYDTYFVWDDAGGTRRLYRHQFSCKWRGAS